MASQIVHTYSIILFIYPQKHQFFVCKLTHRVVVYDVFMKQQFALFIQTQPHNYKLTATEILMSKNHAFSFIINHIYKITSRDAKYFTAN